MTHTISSLLERGYTHWNDAAVLTKVSEELGNRNRLEYSAMFAKRAIELAPSASIDPYLSLAFACFRNPITPPEEGNRILAQGYEATGSGAARAWQAAVADDESQAALWLEEARKDTSLAGQIAVAVALTWRGKIDESYEAYCAIGRNFPMDNAMEWGEYCSTMLFFKQRGKEVDVEGDIMPRITNLIDADPDSIGHRQIRMRCYAVLENRDAAMNECLDILSRFPDDESTMFLLAGMYEKKGDDDSAILWCNRAIGAKPSYVGARIRLGGIYERQGKTALAEMVMREIPKVNPDYRYGSIEFAYFLFRNDKQEEAVTVFREAWEKLFAWEKRRVESNETGKALLEHSGLMKEEAS